VTANMSFDSHLVVRPQSAAPVQEPVDQPYGVRDAAVRDPSGNHLRLSQPLAQG
jgi:hypothetical protein